MSGSDAEVIASSLADPAEFAVIFDRHVRRVERFVGFRVGPSVVDDLVAETFRIGFERRELFRSVSAGPWLLGIALNLTRRHHRSLARAMRAQRREAGETLVSTDPLSTVDDRLDAHRHAERVAVELDAMPSGEREALLMAAWDDLTPTEIGDVLGVPAATVRTRLRRARQRLRRVLDGEPSAPSAEYGADDAREIAT